MYVSISISMQSSRPLCRSKRYQHLHPSAPNKSGLLLAAGPPSSSPRLFPLYNMHKYNCLSYYADGGMIAAAEIVQFAIVSP